MFEKETLFGFPVYKVKVDPRSFDKDKIVDDITENYKRSPTRSQFPYNDADWHHGFGSRGNDDFITIDFTRLTLIYNTILGDFFNNTYGSLGRFFYEFNIANYTASKTGQSMRPHSHLPSSFSCVHYLKFNEQEHIPVKFENPGHYHKYSDSINPQEQDIMSKDLTTSYMACEWSPNVEENDMIIFPAALEHRVPMQQSDDLRISIVTNIDITLP